MVRALQATILIDPPFRKRRETVGAAIVEGDPVSRIIILPEDDVSVEELKWSRPAGIEVLDERDGVPVVSP